jgi:hypothetical protein
MNPWMLVMGLQDNSDKTEEEETDEEELGIYFTLLLI